MTWLLLLPLPVIAFLLLWLLAVIGEERWKKTVYDEEWEK